MVGREEQIKTMQKAMRNNYSTFAAVTGRRRVGKTFLIRQVYGKDTCFSITGIQNGSLHVQINNFIQKLTEHDNNFDNKKKIKNWQDVFVLFKKYLQSLSKKKKQVIIIDELPWIATPKSGFIQLLAHLWNDYLSQEKHFILLICGSATSWIREKIINDKGGFHNRINLAINLAPFTLAETKQFFQSKKIQFTDTGIAEIYMAMGGLPYYLEQIERGESPTKAIERLCFSSTGILKWEFDNLYKALFSQWENHEAIVKALARVQMGLTRENLIEKSKIKAGGPFTRTVQELITSGFVSENIPFGRNKRGVVYRLTDEYTLFYFQFIKGNENKESTIWQNISNSQKYKIWKGHAFETLCLKHVSEIKTALGINGIYTETSSYRIHGTSTKTGFQIDLLIDRKDAAINLCECKFYESNFEITKKYAQEIKNRKAAFQLGTKTKKMLLNTFISNEDLVQNDHYFEVVDSFVHLRELMK